MIGPTARRRLVARTALVLSGVMLASLAVAEVPVPRSAEAAVGDDLVTTSSTRTVKWTEQNPRDPRDAADSTDPLAYDKLEDLQLRVSQTQDLLNQTVQVSYEGLGTTGKETFLQLMQCWSDGSNVPPTREQCAFGGIDVTAAEGTGFGRTRQLDVDPRERTYRNDGDLNPVSVDGAVPPSSWPQEAQLVLGTNQQTCPDAAVGYAVSLVPPRAAVTPGGLPASIVIEQSPSTRPGSVTRQENGSPRTYATVTSPIQFSAIAAARGLPRLPFGQYRLQLGCTAADGVEVARFIGYLDHNELPGGPVWQRGAHAGGVVVPFDPLGDTADTRATDPYERDEVLEYLKPRSTNEIWQALRRADGGGSVFMEMQTDLEAQHLGCGRVEIDKKVRSCWLVAVPRFGVEPSGADQETSGLYSPLSQTLWDRRIEIPLAFAPVAAGCQIGSGLKQVLSHDSALNALRSWQPTFCGNPDTATSVLGPLQDFSIRGGVSKPNRMGVVGVPDEGGGTIVTAPIATSAVVVGFAVDRRISFGQEDFALNGTRATVMNLNARLVAKLLTQSYDSGAAPNGGKATGFNSPARSGDFKPTFTPARNFPADNPRTLYDDPEFLRLNPDFVTWLKQAPPLPPLDMADILVSPEDTDAYNGLWRWIVADEAAGAFLAGTADPDGMLINPYYKGQITAETSSFPQFDPTCMDDIEDPKADAFPLLCQINNHPRVEDDGEAAQAAVRGDTKRFNSTPPLFTGAAGEGLSFLPEPRQQQGKLGMLVITTSAVAERFGLPTARLKNSDGEFVPATAATMARARDQMTARADGVLVPDPTRVGNGGYPLTTNSYAVVDVGATTQAQNNAFAAILDYAAGPGQRTGTAVGQLPPGYAPLTPAQSTQTRAAASLLRDPSSLVPTDIGEEEGELDGEALDGEASDGEALDGEALDGEALDGEAGDAIDGDGDGVDGAELAGEAGAALGGLETTTEAMLAGTGPITAPQVTRPAGATAGSSSSLRWALPVLLLIGLLAAIGGRVLSLLGRPSA